MLPKNPLDRQRGSLPEIEPINPKLAWLRRVPGFRTGDPIKMAFAIPLYCIAIGFLGTMVHDIAQEAQLSTPLTQSIKPALQPSAVLERTVAHTRVSTPALVAGCGRHLPNWLPFIGGGGQPSLQETAQSEGLLGAVRQVSTSEVQDDNEVLVRQELYNTAGQVVKDSHYDRSGVETSHEIYAFESGLLRNAQRFSGDEERFDTTYVYDTHGRVTSEAVADRKYGATHIDKYAYDGDGNCVTVGTQKSLYKKKNATTIVVLPLDAATSTSDHVTFRFEANQINVDHKVADGSHEIFAFDLSGNTLSSTIENQEIKSTKYFTRSGTPEHEVFEMPARAGNTAYHGTTNYTYEIDNHGNWTKQIETFVNYGNDGSIHNETKVKTREIEYY